jgi:adenine-specific DNA-methyltransferase
MPSEHEIEVGKMPVRSDRSLLPCVSEETHGRTHHRDRSKGILNSSSVSSLVSFPKPRRSGCTAHLLTPGKDVSERSILTLDHALWQGDVEMFLKNLPGEPLFDLIVTSPPYNIGKEYETRTELDKYLEWQERVIGKLIPLLRKGGSLCWQVGNYVDDNEIFPLDIEFAPIFKKHKLQLRNRIIWQFGHGLHTQKRFSGRYEVVLWYTKTDSTKDPYTFNLDAVRVPAKYPGKKHFKGPNAGRFSGNPLGKNPEDVWNIPNVKSNHVEKTDHPCQFPVGLIERLVLALTNPGALVFDPFAGVASAGVAAAVHGRRFWGCEVVAEYAQMGRKRLQDALNGSARYRPHDKALYDHTKSNLSKAPAGFRER